MDVRSYRDLHVWQDAMDLAVACYELTSGFPRAEMFGLSSQIRRSSTSIAANIAEGYGRQSTGAYIQFLRIAQGSLKELETYLLLSERVGLVTREAVTALLASCESVGRMLVALIRSLDRGSRP